MDRLWSMRKILWILLAVAGCSSAPKQVVPKDSQLSRHVTDGREAFNEGDLTAAEKQYHRALLRAWAIDDPYESGTVAYNLAACLVSREAYGEAADWLVDSRAELCRAGTSTGNSWLLSAEIAMAQNRFEDADRFVNYAACVSPPCEIGEEACLCGPSEACCEEPCQDCCIVRLPCIGKKIEHKQAVERCEQGYQARIELTRARLAAKQLDLCTAKQHLQRACEMTIEACDLSLQADRHDVAALIHDLEACFLQAGAHRDREVRLLRCIGHYREIPNVLDAAAESYKSAERMDLAIDRMIRSARIRFARGELEPAWERVRMASELASFGGCQAVEIRLSLTAKMIRDAIDRQPDDPRIDTSTTRE